MFTIDNFLSNPNMEVIENTSPFILVKMKNTGQYQAICNIKVASVICPKDTLSWMAGNIEESEVQTSGEFAPKALKNKQTGIMNQKYEYNGVGYLILKPVDLSLILLDLKEWNEGIALKNDSLYVYQADLHQKVIPKSSTSINLVGGDGDAAISFQGSGLIIARSTLPKPSLIEVQLNNDIINIDEESNQVIAWSSSLRYLAEKKKTGKIISQFKGTGKILFAPGTPLKV